MARSVSAWSGPSLAFIFSSVCSNRGTALPNWPSFMYAEARLPIVWSVWGWSGARLAFLFSRVCWNSGSALSSRPLIWYACARLFMLASVSGWSGPSEAFLFSSACFEQRQCPGELTRGHTDRCHGVHALERVEVVGTQRGLPFLQVLFQQRQRLGHLAVLHDRRGQVVDDGQGGGVVGAGGVTDV